MNLKRPNILVIGSLNMDIVVEMDRYPDVGETVSGRNVSFVPGGKGANQAVAAARLGAAVSMIGAVGEDAFGIQLLSSIQIEGVDIAGIKKTPGAATGVASIHVAEGDNSIVVVAGANGAVEREDIDRNENMLKAADIVLLQLEIPVDVVLHAARRAKALGKMVLINPAPAHRVPEELFQLADYITPNRSELLWYTGAEMDASSVESAMRRMKEMGAAHIITTLGAEGCAYLDHDGTLRTVPGHKMPVVDTTGAGDCFNASFAVAAAAGKGLKEAIEFASIASALSVTKLGAQAGMPKAEDIANFHAARTL